MNPLVAVLFLAVAAQAAHPLPSHMQSIVNTEGEQYKLYETYTKSITLSSEDQKYTFDGLNVHGSDDVITKDDLQHFYWHDDLKYAIKRFLKFVDDNADNEIKHDELNDEFKEKAVLVALIECHYLKSKGLKTSCLSDQLLTYASLYLGDNDVKEFQEFIGGTDGISREEAENIDHAKNHDKKATAEELGAYYGNDGVSADEFKDYVTQECISDDFRRCRTGTPDVNTGKIDFNNECLKHELVEHANDDLTEMDISVLFRAFDKDGNNQITKKEILELPGIQGTPDCAAKADRIMNLLDMSLTTPKNTEPVVDYGEFRTYMRTPTVQLQAEHECTEPLKKQHEELNCLYDLTCRLFNNEHDTIWMGVPDLEQQIAFEGLDTSNDGELKPTELTLGDDKTKHRFMAEMDHDNSGYVCLEEWNEYMDIPHMVYGTGDCLLQTRSKEGRGHCVPKEIIEVFENIKHFEKEFWTKWFKFYDTNADNVITITDNNEAAEKFGSQDLEKLFLSEIGQGDDKISFFEFLWYVKQQELADRYENLVKAGKHNDYKEFHKLLMHYIENDLTEYDTQQFFDKLDSTDNHELEKNDFGTDLWPKIEELLKKIDGVDPHGDKDQTVNFREFWLWLNSQTNPGQAKKTYVKDKFEEECTTKIKGANQQEEEIKCYVEYFKNHAEELSKLC